jgi:hypothetical protein
MVLYTAEVIILFGQVDGELKNALLYQCTQNRSVIKNNQNPMN